MIFKELATFFSLKNSPNLFSFRFGTFCSRAQPPEVVVSDTIVELFISIFLCSRPGFLLLQQQGDDKYRPFQFFEYFSVAFFRQETRKKGRWSARLLAWRFINISLSRQTSEECSVFAAGVKRTLNRRKEVTKTNPTEREKSVGGPD